jgi:tripartite-type tricarboxylate transporter receptor subunit TctC
MPSFAANAQEWPIRPIKLIVPFPAGGGTDLIARVMAQHLSARLGQQVFVENRGGANGAIGLAALKQSPPDGYTLAVTSDTPLVVNPSLQPNLGYKPLEDFTPVSSLIRFPSLIVAHPSAGIRTIPDLIAAAKATPGGVTYSSAGAGNFSHLAMEIFSQQAGLKLLHVPYRGVGPATLGVVAGEVQLSVSNVQVALENIRAGQLVAVGVGELERMPVLPDVPTIAETLPGFSIASWAGVLVPAKTPEALVSRLHEEIAAILADPQVRERLEAQQIKPLPLPQAAFAELIRNDLARWAKFIKATGVGAE